MWEGDEWHHLTRRVGKKRDEEQGGLGEHGLRFPQRGLDETRRHNKVKSSARSNNSTMKASEFMDVWCRGEMMSFSKMGVLLLMLDDERKSKRNYVQEVWPRISTRT